MKSTRVATAKQLLASLDGTTTFWNAALAMTLLLLLTNQSRAFSNRATMTARRYPAFLQQQGSRYLWGVPPRVNVQQHINNQQRHGLPATTCFLHHNQHHPFSSSVATSSYFMDEYEEEEDDEDDDDDFLVEEVDLAPHYQTHHIVNNNNDRENNDFLTEFFNVETPDSIALPHNEAIPEGGNSLPAAPTTANNDVGFCVTAPFEPAGDQPEAIQKLLEQLKDNKSPVAILRGITGTGKTLVMSHVIAGLQKPTLVLCHNKTLAAQLARELRSYLGKNAVELFVSYYNHYVPESFVESTGRYTAKKSSINRGIDALRHRATRSLLTRRDVVVVATVSCIYGLGLPQEYLNASVEWKQDELLDVVGSEETETGNRDALFQPLMDMMYRLVEDDADFSAGTFQHFTVNPEKQIPPPEALGADFVLSKHHKIVLWPPHERFPSTIWVNEWRSDQSASRYQISVLQQGTAEGLVSVPSMRLFPANHHVVGADNMEHVCRAIEDELADRMQVLKNEKKFEAADRLQKRVVNDVYMLRETNFCSGLENYSRHIRGKAEGEPPDTLLDYISTLAGNEWLLLMDESHVTFPQVSAMYRGDQSRKHSLVKHGYRLPSALDNRPLKGEEFWAKVQQTLFVSATPGKRELELSKDASIEPVDMHIRPTHVIDPPIDVRPRKDSVDDLIHEIAQRAQRQERSLAITLTKRDAEDLARILGEKNINATYLHSGLSTDDRAVRISMLQTGEVDALVGVNCLREGLDLPQVSLVGVLNADTEGMLRSDTALLQVVGRAARNKHGTAIFYADRITNSMQRCIDETNKRRAKQIAYNAEHGLEPKSTKGSSMMSLFDLLEAQIKAEQQLEITTPENIEDPAAKALESMETLRVSGEKDQKLIETDHIPNSPGVYHWKDEDGKILYIGKAAKLRARIRSYLAPNANHSPRIKKMMKLATSIDFVLVPSERDALVLESNLIKRHQPPFNVLLKDDEHYPYICASVGDQIPRFSVVPHLPGEEESALSRHQYFGPFTSFSEINALLDGIEEKYDLRAKSFLARHDNGSLEEYKELFQKALSDVFTSKSTSELQKLRSEYDEAGLLFDSKYNVFRDVVAVAPVEGSKTELVVHVAQLRQGFVTGRFSYSFSTPSGMECEEELAEAVQILLEQKHYSSGREVSDPDLSFFPQEILLPFDLPNIKAFRKSIRGFRKKAEPNRKGSIVIKQRGKRGDRAAADAKALAFASVNAQQYAAQLSSAQNDVVSTSVDGTAAQELAEMLALDRPPSRIECYDISHTQGDEAVGSRVVFVDGKPAKHLYRRFNIKTVDGVDDYASLAEVLGRRFRRTQAELGHHEDQGDAWQVPDLVLIDGGKGQLGAAMKGISEANSGASVPICSIAKNQEEIFVPHQKSPVNESPDSPGLLLLRHLRDESHRFALKNHRKRRSKANLGL